MVKAKTAPEYLHFPIHSERVEELLIDITQYTRTLHMLGATVKKCISYEVPSASLFSNGQRNAKLYGVTDAYSPEKKKLITNFFGLFKLHVIDTLASVCNIPADGFASQRLVYRIATSKKAPHAIFRCDALQFYACFYPREYGLEHVREDPPKPKPSLSSALSEDLNTYRKTLF